MKEVANMLIVVGQSAKQNYSWDGQAKSRPHGGKSAPNHNL